jgi:hypothetical protein
MSATHKLGEQITATRTAARVVSGAEKPPSSAREREYLASCVSAGAETLEWMRRREVAVKRVDEAVALLRRARVVISGSDLGDEITAFLGDVAR